MIRARHWFKLKFAAVCYFCKADLEAGERVAYDIHKQMCCEDCGSKDVPEAE